MAGYVWTDGKIEVSPVWLDENAGVAWAAAKLIRGCLDGKPTENDYDAGVLVNELEDLARELAKMVGQEDRFPA